MDSAQQISYYQQESGRDVAALQQTISNAVANVEGINSDLAFHALSLISVAESLFAQSLQGFQPEIRRVPLAA